MKAQQTLYAFYDLAVSPATFDFVVFLMLAEHARKERGLAGIHPVIVPGYENGFRAGDLATYHRIGAINYNAESLRWRLRNIIIPACGLLPACGQISVCGTREEAAAMLRHLAVETFPAGYDPADPKPSYGWRLYFDTTDARAATVSLKAAAPALAHVKKFFQQHACKRKVVSITLRECDHEPDRNSSLEDWGAFASRLDSKMYCPVLIRDNGAAYRSLPAGLRECVVFPEAAWNLEIRAALYEQSYINMFVNNGPAMLSLFNRRSRTLIFKIITESCGSTSSRYFESVGIKPGQQYRFMTPVQKLVWEKDTFDVIWREFALLVETIDWFENAPLETLRQRFDAFIAQKDYGKAEWIAKLTAKRFGNQAAAKAIHATALHMTQGSRLSSAPRNAGTAGPSRDYGPVGTPQKSQWPHSGT